MTAEHFSQDHQPVVPLLVFLPLLFLRGSLFLLLLPVEVPVDLLIRKALSAWTHGIRRHHELNRVWCSWERRQVTGFVGRTLERASAGTLLHYMCQLMRQQAASFVRPGRKAARPKNKIASHRISMYSHTGKVPAEVLFHVLPQCWIERHAGTREGAVYAGRRCIRLLGGWTRHTLDVGCRAARDGLRWR